MLELIEQHVEHGDSFAFETTLASRSFAKHIPVWRGRGYVVTIYYLTLPSANDALKRVAVRVQQGGHDVPEQVVRRRFAASRRNFDEIYKALVDRWHLVNNLGQVPILIESGTHS